LNLSASSVVFGTDTVGMTSSRQMLLVSNTGNATLTLGAISIAGTGSQDFVDGGSCSAGLLLAPGASCYLYISFDPTETGARSATLQIGNSTVTLSGTGVPPPDSGDGPLPLWAYVVLGVLLMAIAVKRQNSFVRSG
jgi:hypothetical protein